MLYSEYITIKSLSLHVVGNKLNQDGIIFSRQQLSVGCEIKDLLVKYFLQPFKQAEYYNLYHDSDLNYNEVYGFVSNIFNDPNTIHNQSRNLAKHLYEKSNHPKIKNGEFFVVYFKDCIIDGKTVDAVGLFKSENKDTILKVYPSNDGFEIESEQGVNINKLDKGALIFNTHKENGFVVAIIDNTNKGGEARYWVDDFLHVRQHKDQYYNTQHVMTLTKKFVIEELPEKFEVSKVDQAELLNKTTQFFKDNDTFDMYEFINEVIVHPPIIDSFNQYKDSYAKERDIEFSDNFSISDTAVKKQARAFKSVIKLDKNFHIYIHGDRQLIEQGEDNKGKFYKVYYKEEQ